MRRASVRASDDDDVGALVARVDGGAQPPQRLVARDDLLALRVPAALGGDLVLDHDAREA